MTCTFFGHRSCYGLNEKELENTIEDLINNGVRIFYVGNQGEFDRTVRATLRKLKTRHPHIDYSVVLAYLPTKNQEYEDYSDTIFPEEIARGPIRFSIDRCNQWMIDHANHCVCYVNHTHGGAYKYAQKAKRRNLIILNLGTTDL